ncbi:hypothetical protein Ahia01_001118200 [Argonauta hians]
MALSKDLVSEISSWQTKVDKHEESLVDNSCPLPKTDENYGRPVEGTKSAIRGEKALKHILREVHELCVIISEIGQHQPDNTVRVTFGELFKAYIRISNKLVGMLIRARRHKLLDFEGEILYQRQDDKVPITLFKVPEPLSF